MCDKKYTKAELERLNDKTDYERLKNMSDEEIEENSENDPDSISPTEEQLKKFRKIKDEKK